MFGCDLGAFTWLCDPHRNDFDVMYFSTCRLGLTSLNKSYAQNEIFHKAIVSKVRSNIALGHLKRRGGVRRHENADRRVVRSHSGVVADLRRPQLPQVPCDPFMKRHSLHHREIIPATGALDFVHLHSHIAIAPPWKGIKTANMASNQLSGRHTCEH